MTASHYRIVGFIAALLVLSAAGYYAGLFGPETPSTKASEQLGAVAEEQIPDANVALRTAYLDKQIGKAHRIFLEWHTDGTGQLMLDETPCTFTRIGEEKPAQPTGKWVEVNYKIAADKTATEEDADAVFEITGVSDSHFRIVKPRNRWPSYRLLVLDRDNKVIRVVTLEQWHIAAQRKNSATIHAQ
jgi:hypothetical protein